jgi:hydroxymethylpyrimidine pyrophosphatase-like HAD family hydrolase
MGVSSMDKIENLQQFYDLMFKTRDARRKITTQYLNQTKINPDLVDILYEALQQLKDIPEKDSQCRLKYKDDKYININLSYEINELVKDIFFLTNTEDEFYNYINKLHPGFTDEVENGEDYLSGVELTNFISDRDGTVNNYCGRYISSIQSVYNAVFLTRFAQTCVKNAVILTSAPLHNTGLIDISVSIPEVFVYAGSKGREYINLKGEINNYPIDRERQGKLDELNEELSSLVKKPDYEVYSMIGSGLQFKFGQTTIARQDIYKSIPEEESLAFLEKIRSLVDSLDPHKKYFRIEDTGKDIEIILTITDSESQGELKDFDKGDGVQFLNKELNLNMEDQPTLVCGDTNSDTPMIPKKDKYKHKDNKVIFVTKNQELKNKVKKMFPQSNFVSEPDALVAILNNLGRKR